MGLISFFKVPERGVYLICVLLGLIVHLMLRPASWASFAGLMITYHLFLLYILLGSDKESSPSYNKPITIAGHLLCVALLTAGKALLPYAYREVTHTLPPVEEVAFSLWGWKVIAVLQYLITYGLAAYERDFLFAGERKKYAKKVGLVNPLSVPALVAVNGIPLAPATGEDHRQWLEDRERRKAVLYAPGTSTQHEFEQWLRARGKTQYSVTQNQSAAASN
jgi:hypothetical protein